MRIVNQALDALKVEKHPDKTFIGKAGKGFDFLGYHFESGLLKPSCQTVTKHAERICRLYEQGAGNNRIRQYVRRWFDWLKAGLGHHVVQIWVGYGRCGSLRYGTMDHPHPADPGGVACSPFKAGQTFGPIPFDQTPLLPP